MVGGWGSQRTGRGPMRFKLALDRLAQFACRPGLLGNGPEGHAPVHVAQPTRRHL